MRLGRRESSGLEHRPDQFVIESWHFVQELAILDMVTLLVAIKLHITRYHLLFCDIFENQEVGLVLVVEVIRS